MAFFSAVFNHSSDLDVNQRMIILVDSLFDVFSLVGNLPPLVHTDCHLRLYLTCKHHCTGERDRHVAIYACGGDFLPQALAQILYLKLICNPFVSLILLMICLNKKFYYFVHSVSGWSLYSMLNICVPSFCLMVLLVSLVVFSF